MAWRCCNTNKKIKKGAISFNFIKVIERLSLDVVFSQSRTCDVSKATLWNCDFWNMSLVNAGLQTISRLAPVKLSGQTYFCSDISHFWPDKHRLRLIAIKVPPHPFTWCLNMKQVNFQSIYCTWASISMQEKWNAWYSKISITFVRTAIASVLRLIYG